MCHLGHTISFAVTVMVGFMEEEMSNRVVNSDDPCAGGGAQRVWKSEIEVAKWNISADERIAQFLGRVARQIGSSQWSIAHHSANGYAFALLTLSDCEDPVSLQIRQNRRTERFTLELIGHSQPPREGSTNT